MPKKKAKKHGNKNIGHNLSDFLVPNAQSHLLGGIDLSKQSYILPSLGTYSVKDLADFASHQGIVQLSSTDALARAGTSDFSEFLKPKEKDADTAKKLFEETSRLVKNAEKNLKNLEKRFSTLEIGVNESEKKAEEISLKYGKVDEKIEELDRGNSKIIETMGIFFGLFTIVSINVQISKFVTNFQDAMTLLLISNGIVFLFVLLILLVGRYLWARKAQTITAIVISFLVGGSFMYGVFRLIENTSQNKDSSSSAVENSTKQNEDESQLIQQNTNDPSDDDGT